jgi:hypothetical protein
VLEVGGTSLARMWPRVTSCTPWPDAARLMNGAYQPDYSPDLGGLQNADLERGSIEVPPGLNPYSDLRPVSRLILINLGPFHCKKCRKIVIHFDCAPLTRE